MFPKAGEGRKTPSIRKALQNKSAQISKCGKFKLGAKITVLMGQQTFFAPKDNPIF